MSHLFSAPPWFCTDGFLVYYRRLPSAATWKLWPRTAPKPQVASPEKLISSVTALKILEKTSTKDSIQFGLMWCLTLHPSAVSGGASLCSTIWHPQLYPHEGEVGGILSEKGRRIRILHSTLLTERRLFNMAEGGSDSGKILNTKGMSNPGR